MPHPNRSRRRIALAASLCCLAGSLTILTSIHPADSPASGPAAVTVSADNWGLSFPVEGETPVGNATEADLARYDAYYVGDPEEKVIYLTFDCGYENGCTAQILDTLQAHQAPAAFLWWAI